MNRLPLPQNNPKHQQHLDAARAAVNDTAEALRRVDVDLWPGLIATLLAQLDTDGLDLERVRRILDDRLAWGDWPEKMPEK